MKRSILVGLALMAACLTGKPQGKEEINTARPGGKLAKKTSIQLMEVAGGLVDPIHVASPKDG
jgi:hypothetical protein